MADDEKNNGTGKHYTTDFTSTLQSWGMKKQEFFRLTNSVPAARSWSDAEKPHEGVSLTLANKMIGVFKDVAQQQKKQGALTFTPCPQSDKPSKK